MDKTYFHILIDANGAILPGCPPVASEILKKLAGHIVDTKTGTEFFEQIVRIVAIPAFMPELKDSGFPFGQQHDKVPESVKVYTIAVKVWTEAGISSSLGSTNLVFRIYPHESCFRK